MPSAGLHARVAHVVHCVAAEPHATVLRVSVVDGETEREIGYETAVLGRLRPGYRVLRLRDSLGTRIAHCYLLVHIRHGSMQHEWATPTDGIDDDDIRMMRNATRLEPFPLPSSNRSHYVPKRASYVANVAVATSPDAGATVVREALLSTRHSLRIYTYQITDVDIADVILDLIRERDVRVSMVLSRAIFMDSDRTASTKVVEYMRENARGNGTMSLRSSPHFFRYAHLKVLIVDDERVVVATGNLSPSDLPFPIPRSFEPASDSGRPVNRDFEVVIDDRRAANAFRLLFEGDSRDSTAYKPPTKF